MAAAKKRESFNPLLKSYPDSEKVNAVSIGAEVLFVRLIAQCDDLAHYYGDPAIVLGKLLTHRMCKGEVDAAAVGQWMGELRDAGLVTFYNVGARRYLEVVNCKKALRNDVAPDVRFPTPDEATTLPADEPGTRPARTRDEPVTNAGRERDESGTLTQPNPTQPNYAVPASGPGMGREMEAGTDRFAEFWNAWPRHKRKVGRDKCEKLWRSRKLDAKADAIIAAVRDCRETFDWTKQNGQFIPKPLSWLNDASWESAALSFSSSGAPGGGSVRELIINGEV
jgi:hypothetical protein